ncbi:hypothetical protein CSKR_203995 [Clonorchis sinensis]|uniref:Uncharacterized protein n=1 Tax=Clonorchis sinensis TaxID=79923 RepID=A0A8T1MRB5_CLOSI|nr:hypothetical protein CSKR_203995 [Clonorchis sinensis]
MLECRAIIGLIYCGILESPVMEVVFKLLGWGVQFCRQQDFSRLVKEIRRGRCLFGELCGCR